MSALLLVPNRSVDGGLSRVLECGGAHGRFVST